MGKIFEWLKRNPCKECIYYIVTNNTCQSKKCATCGNHSEVTIIDRLFCEPCKEQEDIEREYTSQEEIEPQERSAKG